MHVDHNMHVIDCNMHVTCTLFRIGQDRVTLINLVKTLVYAKSESFLLKKYEEFCYNSVVKKYPNFFTHMQSLWLRRSEWAVCYRSQLPVSWK